jgi:histidine triad (HIT) family protein
LLPKKVPIGKLQDAKTSDAESLGHLMIAAGKVAEQLGITDGYRLVINEGQHGQQSVNYLHVHFFAGKQCHWPPL